MKILIHHIVIAILCLSILPVKHIYELVFSDHSSYVSSITLDQDVEDGNEEENKEDKKESNEDSKYWNISSIKLLSKDIYLYHLVEFNKIYLSPSLSVDTPPPDFK